MKKARVNQKPKALETALLFPGNRLDRPLLNLQEGATWIGHAFERLTKTAFGGLLLSHDSGFKLNPDVIDEQNNTIYESKSCVSGSCWILSQAQLDEYVEHQKETGTHCLYALWTYRHRRPTRTTKTGEECLRAVIGSTEECWLVDVRVLKRLSQLVPEGCSRRENCKLYYGDGRVLVRNYFTLRLKFFKNLLQDFRGSCRRFGLDCNAWELQAQDFFPRRISVDGVRITSCAFRVYRFDESIPF